MSRRKIQAPTRTTRTEGWRRGSYTEEHPAFGVAILTRGSGTKRALFQSDILHSDTMTLSIHRADRTRDLHHDWVHPGEELIEVEMSLAQFGALVSSPGLGSGVPVTIRRTESELNVPGVEHQPRLAQTVDEAKTAVEDLLRQTREKADILQEAFDGKQGVRAVREALNALQAALRNAAPNAEFAIKSVQGAAETAVNHAKADIEAQILQAEQRVRALSEEMPPYPALGPRGSMSDRIDIDDAVANSPDDGEEI